MVCMILFAPSTSPFHPGRRLSRIPRGTPMATASSMETPTSQRCSLATLSTSLLWATKKSPNDMALISGIEDSVTGPECVYVRLHKILGGAQKLGGREHAWESPRIH